MKWPISAIILVILLIVIIPFGSVFGIRYLPGGIQPSLTNTEKIYDQVTLTQSFISPKDNLEGIGVSIKNPNFANKKDVTFKIYDENHDLVRTVVLNGKNIADGKFVKIFFEPINDSLNRKFTWFISSPDSKFEDALEIFLTDNKPNWSEELKVGEKLTPDSLSYITLHKVKNSTEVLNLIILGLINRLIQDRIFFVVYSLFLIILLVGIVISSKSQSQNSKKPE